MGKRNFIYLSRISAILFILLLIPLNSCRKKEDYSLRESAIQLYSDSYKLIMTYSDSMALCKDSASVSRIDSRFEKLISEVNFRYPSNTCYEMSEDENDTIASMTTKYVHLRDSLLYSFAHPSVKPDSLVMETDSLFQKEPSEGKEVMTG